MKMKNSPWLYAALITSFALSGCNELSLKFDNDPEDEIEEPADPTPQPQPEPTKPQSVNGNLVLEPARMFNIVWEDVEGADYYRAFENPDGVSGFTQIGADVQPGVGFVSFESPLLERVNSEYMIEACNDLGCSESDPIYAEGNMADGIGYIKSLFPYESTAYGVDIELSNDGTVLVVSSGRDNAPTVDDIENQGSQGGTRFGAVHIYKKGVDGWEVDQYLKPDLPGNTDSFGSSVALSGDGTRLIAGSPNEESMIASDPTDNSGSYPGAAYIFERGETGWVQTAFIKPNVIKQYVNFGSDVDMSEDGNRIIVGAQWDNSASKAINGNEGDTSLNRAGAAYIFDFDGTQWTQTVFLKASDSASNDYFGEQVSLSSDGNVALVGAKRSDGPTKSTSSSGQAYVFRNNGGVWSQEAILIASNSESGDYFGEEVVLSGNGKYAIIGASGEDSAATGINGNESNNDLFSSGAVYVFEENAGSWTQKAYIKEPIHFTAYYQSSNLGGTLAINEDATQLIVGHEANDSDYIGLENNPFDYGKPNSGAAYLYSRENDTWTLDFVLKASNAEASDRFGTDAALSGEGTIAVSAEGENSSSPGINADQSDNDRPYSGAVYLY